MSKGFNLDAFLNQHERKSVPFEYQGVTYQFPPDLPARLGLQIQRFSGTNAPEWLIEEVIDYCMGAGAFKRFTTVPDDGKETMTQELILIYTYIASGYDEQAIEAAFAAMNGTENPTLPLEDQPLTDSV